MKRCLPLAVSILANLGGGGGDERDRRAAG